MVGVTLPVQTLAELPIQAAELRVGLMPLIAGRLVLALPFEKLPAKELRWGCEVTGPGMCAPRVSGKEHEVDGNLTLGIRTGAWEPLDFRKLRELSDVILDPVGGFPLPRRIMSVVDLLL